MSGKPSKENQQAKTAYEKSLAAGKPMTVLELSQKFKIAPSTIYRAKWYQTAQVKEKDTGA